MSSILSREASASTVAPSVVISHNFAYWDHTEQEVFDHVTSALLRQNSRSYSAFYGHDGLAYRAMNGSMCAIGHVLPDSVYNAEFEGKPIRSLIRDFGLSTKHLGLLESLQVVHDHSDPCEWPDEFRAVAKGFGLPVNF